MSEGHRPLVSIGLPVHNGMPYLPEAIESVLNQTYQNIEVIISDNASTDGTESYCRTLAQSDARVRYIRQPANQGAAENFNTVFRAGRGEYFKWLAADDVMAAGFVEHSLSALAANPSAVLAVPDAHFVDPQGRDLGTGGEFLGTSAGFWPGGSSRVATYRSVLRAVLADGRAAMPVVFALGRTSAFRRAGTIGAYYAADCVFACSLALSGPFIGAPNARLYLRRHDQSSSSGDRAHDPKLQQEFYNPLVRSSRRISLNYRRRYAELFRLPLTMQSLPPAHKLMAASSAISAISGELFTRALLRALRLIPKLRHRPFRGSAPW